MLNIKDHTCAPDLVEDIRYHEAEVLYYSQRVEEAQKELQLMQSKHREHYQYYVEFLEMLTNSHIHECVLQRGAS